jgi:hypothetical protein
MQFVTLTLAEVEWARAKEAVQRQWPNERVSHTETARRVLLAGTAALRQARKSAAPSMPNQGDINRLVGD